jgi:YHS domain-containing protein
MTAPPEFLLFLGRFHPVLVHLPIGFLFVLGLLELLARSRRWKGANASAGYILALTLPACALAAACGWLLSLGGGYDAGLVAWHKWTGIATTAACVLAAWLYRCDLKKAYRGVLAVTLGTLTVASHFGGSLTHGSNYLLELAPAPLRALLGSPRTNPEPVAPTGDSPQAYTHVVAPVLAQYCVGCHGPEKAKGDLRLDSASALLSGGGAGPAVVAGDAAASLLLQRMRLPLAHEDHMPPEGKPQPSADDLGLLTWWINAGAPAAKTVAELNPPPGVQRVLERRLARPVSAAPAAATPKPLAELFPVVEPLARELGVALSALSQNEPWLQVNASLAGTNFTDAALARLAPAAANLRWLDLGGTAITDAGLTNLAGMTHLTRLHLPRTAITDAGLAHLALLAELESLNLYATAVTDAGLASLERLPKLKQLYLWQTQVTPAAAKAFAEARLDQAQLKRWQEELAQLQANLRNARMTVDLGATTNAPAATNATACNTNCPVSGKPVVATQTSLYEGRLVAFCCGDCKAAFDKEPTKFAAKLPPISAAVPVNTKCPVSGKDVDSTKTSVFEGKLVAFCCGDCKASFDKDPKPFLAKLGLGTPNNSTPKEKQP